MTNISTGKVDTKVSQASVSQNYPNPFNPTTTIRFKVKNASHVLLQVFDILGREVAMLTDKYYAPGEYHIVFEAANISSGLYFYQIQLGDFKEKRKMIKIE